jgi:hypothetical protein
MVKHALEHGIKSTAKVFSTTPKTVRKWLARYAELRFTYRQAHCPSKDTNRGHRHDETGLTGVYHRADQNNHPSLP